MRRHLKWAIPVSYVMLLILVTAISHAVRSSSPAKQVAAPANSSPVSGPAVSSPTHGPSTATPSTAQTAGSAGHIGITSTGVALPDPRVTPGAINHKVTQRNIDSTICASGYSASIRPTSAYTTGIKMRQLRAGYSYESDPAPSDYEEDHLISLELGGSPTSVKNLWPEPYATSVGAHAKDKIENKLHSLVCDHSITLTFSTTCDRHRLVHRLPALRCCSRRGRCQPLCRGQP